MDRSLLYILALCCLFTMNSRAQTVKLYSKSGIFKGTYTKISDALAASIDEDSMVLSAHTFYENKLSNLLMKSNVLQGTISGKDTTVINSSGGTAIYLFKGVLRDIVFTGGAPSPSGDGGAIAFFVGRIGGNTVIRNNTGKFYAVHLNGGDCLISDNVKVINNIILDSTINGSAAIVAAPVSYNYFRITDNVLISGNNGGMGAIRVFGINTGDTNATRGNARFIIDGNVRIENNEGYRTGGISIPSSGRYIEINGATIINNRFKSNGWGAAIAVDSGNGPGSSITYDSIGVPYLRLNKVRIYNPLPDGTRQNEIRLCSRKYATPKPCIFYSEGCWWGENDTTGLIKKDPGTIFSMPNWSVTNWYCIPSSSTVTNVMAQMKLNTGAALPPSSLKTIEGKYSATAGSFSASTVPINSSNIVNSVFTYPSSGTFVITASIDADTFRPTNKELHIAETGFETVKIYPNPASDVLHISGIEKGSVIALFDMGGRMLLHQIATGTVEQLTLAPLAAGTYLMELITLSGSKGHVTVMKE